MRLGTLVGIILIILGVVGLAAGGFSFTHKEKVIDLGPIEATADKKESVAIPPVRRYDRAGGGCCSRRCHLAPPQLAGPLFRQFPPYNPARHRVSAKPDHALETF